MKKCIIFFILLIAVLLVAILTDSNFEEQQEANVKMTALAE